MIVYGTRITSDRDFPLALPTGSSSKYAIKLSGDIPVELSNAITSGLPFYRAHGRQVYLYSDQVQDGYAAGQAWCYEVKDIVRFYWRGDEKTIYYILESKGNARLLSFWFIHLLLPLYLTLENMYDFLHGGALEVDGNTIIFIAPSMGGKSTLTDYFVQRGHSLISDDKIPTFIHDNTFMAIGSHPYRRPYRKFEELGYETKRFIADARPIHALYTLEKSANNADITINEITGFEKFARLQPNHLYMFDFLKAQRLSYLSKMLNQVRLFQVQLPWDMERLDEVHDTIYQHSRTIP